MVPSAAEPIRVLAALGRLGVASMANSKGAPPARRNGVAAFCRTQMGHRVVPVRRRKLLERARKRELWGADASAA